MKRMFRILKWIFYFSVAAGMLGGIGIGVFLYDLSKTLPQNLEEELHKRNDILPTVLYDNEGNQVGEFFLQRRVEVSYKDFPPHLIQALLASEDSRFFSHYGIDPIRMFKAFLVNIETGRFAQGASTLTQQTARLFLLSKDKHLIRKLREILLAFQMEQKFSKEQILSLYLNKVFFGNAEGVEAASQGYFGKHAKELSLSESALLVGLLPAPSRYAPTRNPDLAISKRNSVLHRMAEEKFISSHELQDALAEPLKLVKIQDLTSDATAHYVEHVRRYLQEKYGYDRLYQGGLRVHLAMNLDYQIYAHEALQKRIRELTKRQGYRGPIKQIIPDANGEISLAQIEEVTGKRTLLMGTIVKGVVTGVSDQQAEITFQGNQKGVLEWSQLKSWRKRQQIDTNGRISTYLIRKIHDAVAIGDVIQVKLADYDSETATFRLDLYQEPKVNGSVLAMQPTTGHVLAMSGGFQYGNSEFNRAIQAKRQPGSAFKPIVYSAALDSGYALNSMLVDSPRAYKTPNIIRGEQEVWKPKNYGNKLMGRVTLRKALVKSLNLPTIGLVEDLGPQKVIDYSRRLGITAKIDKNLTIALGSLSTTLQEMVKAYSVFANEGRLAESIFITRVEDHTGKVLEELIPRYTNVLPKETAFLMTDMMRDVVETGTGRRARAIGRPSAGKTGTTNESVDAWYIGYIPQLLTGVYVGFDSPRTMGAKETGAKAAAPVWIDFMKNAVRNLPTEQFHQPSGVITAKIHKSGRRAVPCDQPKEIYYEHFRAGTEPPLDPVLNTLCESQQNRIVSSNSEKEKEIEL